MSDFDMSEHTVALSKLQRSLDRDPGDWDDDDLVAVQRIAKEVAGTAETIRLGRALLGR